METCILKIDRGEAMYFYHMHRYNWDSGGILLCMPRFLKCKNIGLILEWVSMRVPNTQNNVVNSYIAQVTDQKGLLVL